MTNINIRGVGHKYLDWAYGHRRRSPVPYDIYHYTRNIKKAILRGCHSQCGPSIHSPRLGRELRRSLLSPYNPQPSRCTRLLAVFCNVVKQVLSNFTENMSV